MQAVSGESRSPILRFASSARTYFVALAGIIASIPFLTRATSRVLPGFASLRSLLGLATSIASYLAIAVLWAARRRIGESAFPPNRWLTASETGRRKIAEFWGPVACSIITVSSLFGYVMLLSDSTTTAAIRFAYTGPASSQSIERELNGAVDGVSSDGQLFGLDGDVYSVAARVSGSGDKRHLVVDRLSSDAVERILNDTPRDLIPNAAGLGMLFALIFVSTASAFIWFALLEYLQREMGHTDRDLIDMPYQAMASRVLDVKTLSETNRGVVLWMMTHSKDRFTVTGPICQEHSRKLKYIGPDGDRYRWRCPSADKKQPPAHELILGFDLTRNSDEARGEGRRIVQETYGKTGQQVVVAATDSAVPTPMEANRTREEQVTTPA